MRFAYVFHIVAGSVGLLAGYLALYARKGAPLHRQAGIAFVYAMVAMCVGGFAMAVGRGVAEAINVPAALLTASLVATGLTTVRPASRTSRAVDRVATVACLTIGVASMTFGVEAVRNGGARDGMPAFPFFMFGVVGLLAGAGDLRVVRSGALTGASRLARHLWRMSFALFIAALSFFIGQAKVIPEPLRIRPLLALPVLAVLLSMLYWLWRVRVRRMLRGIVQVGAPEVA